MILGIGTDLLDESRIKKVFEKFENRTLKKFLSSEEINIFGSIEDETKKINFVAKRFSAKESMLKAMGIGLGRGLELKDISIMNNEQGKPYIKCNSVAEKFISDFYKKDIKNIKFVLSITDEKNLINTITIVSEENE